MALIYYMENDAFTQEARMKDTRVAFIKDAMKRNNITEEELWRNTIEISLDFVDDVRHIEQSDPRGAQHFTIASLLGFLSADKDKFSRNAVMYGNMLDETERDPYQHSDMTEEALAPMIAIAESRYKQFKTKVEAFFKKEENAKFLKLLDAFDTDFAQSGARLNRAAIEYTNTPITRISHYFPMYRTSPTGGVLEANVRRDIMANTASAGFTPSVNKGMTKDRVVISPQYQTAIELDITRVWAASVDATEHFIAYADSVRTLNAVYKGAKARPVRTAISRRYGENALRFIDQTISEAANPHPVNARKGLDRIARAMRGKMATAYLAGKISGIIKQFITSPMLFFQYIHPFEYIANFGKQIDHMWQTVEEKSMRMKHRSFDPITELLDERAAAGKGGGHAIDRLNRRLMGGLEWIDRTCVIPGWMAVYNKTHAILARGYSSWSKDNAKFIGTVVSEERLNALRNGHDFTAAERERYAVLKADNVVRLTQPDNYNIDKPSAFKGEGHEVMKLLTQFQYSLSITYQTIRYDLPQAAKDWQIWQIVGGITSILLTGMVYGAVTEGFHDDDDDAEKKARRFAFWQVMQVTGSVPVLGDALNYAAESLITGSPRRRPSLDLFPIYGKASNLFTNTYKAVSEQDAGYAWRAAANAAEVFFLSTGLPLSGAKEAGRVLGIKSILDLKNGTFGFKPENLQALIGRRDYD
jgi:hypothetical protein